MRTACVTLFLISDSVFAVGPVPTPLQNVPIPPVPGLLDGSQPIVVDKTTAIALGKALFRDVNTSGFTGAADNWVPRKTEISKLDKAQAKKYEAHIDDMLFTGM